MIYVDTLVLWPSAKAPRCFRGRPSCHMATDGDPEELHTFAARIGMRRAWFQDHLILPHYDLTEGRRAAAVALGAAEVTGRDMIRIMRALRASRGV